MEILSITPLAEGEAGARKGRPPGSLNKLRASHHDRARMLALGFTPAQVGRALGMTAAAIRIWAEAPANAELIASYREGVTDSAAGFIAERTQLMNANALLAEQLIHRQLVEAAEEGTEIPLDKLVKIAADANDRTGLGRQETRVNMNLDLGARLDKAAEAKKAVDGARAEGKVVKFARRV